MLKNLARMKHALTEWAIKESILDDASFLTHKEWNDRGEKIHNDALMVLVIDGSGIFREGANKQVISSQADSLIKISRIWADFFPANTSN